MSFHISQEQVKSSLLTSSLLLALLLFLYVVEWENTRMKPVLQKDFLEVNLGDADDGKGAIPILKEGGAEQVILSNASVPTPISTATNDAPEEAIEAVAQKEKDLPEVKAIEKKKIAQKKKNEVKKIIPSPVKKVVPKPVVNQATPTKQVVESKTPIVPTQKKEPVEVAPKPKAVFKGLENNSGNDAHTNNAVQSQGVGKAVLGDMGKPNGNPNATNYEGAGGNGGIQVNMSSDLVDRGITNMPKFQADFNQNAMIKIEIKVNENGDASFVRVVKMNTTNPDFISIIKQKLQQLKFKSKEDESYGTIEFNFKVGR